ncbi:MAG: hypothetical protein O3B08_18310, partial [Proteobacteria bacterium]|nr:hypothetical protein [Pseudomonadota bacterium]
LQAAAAPAHDPGAFEGEAQPVLPPPGPLAAAQRAYQKDDAERRYRNQSVDVQIINDDPIITRVSFRQTVP